MISFVLTLALICWGDNSKKDRLDKIERKAEGMVGKIKQDDLYTLFQQGATNKMLEFLKDSTHLIPKKYRCRQIEHSSK